MYNRPYHWQSTYTGEIVSSIKDVIYSIYFNIRYYGVYSLKQFKWSYSRKGF